MREQGWLSLILLLISGLAFPQSQGAISVGDVRLKLGSSESSVIGDLSKKYEVGLVGEWKHGAELFVVRDKSGEIGLVSFRNRRLAGVRKILFSETDSGDFPDAFYTAIKNLTARAGGTCKVEIASLGEWHGVMFRCPRGRLGVGISGDENGKKTAGIQEFVGDAE